MHVHEKQNYNKTKGITYTFYQIYLHFVFQMNSLGCLASSFSFEVLSGFGSYLSSSRIPIEMLENVARCEEEQKIKQSCRKYPFIHLSKAVERELNTSLFFCERILLFILF